MELQHMTDEATGGKAAVESEEVSEAATDETSQIEATKDDGPKELVEEATDEDQTDDADDSEGDEDAVEMRVYDFGGNKMEIPKDAVPPELAEKIEDFTKGTWAKFTKDQQANVEKAKALSTQESAVAKIINLNGQALQTYSRGLQLRTEIEQLEKVDFDELWQSDPDQARRVSDLKSSKQAEFQNIVDQVGRHDRALSEAQQSEVARRSDEGKAVLDRRFKDFSTEKAPEVVKYVVEKYGMSQDDADQWAMNPSVTEMAYKAMLYDRMQAAKPTKKPTQAKPVTAMKAKGGTSGSHDPDKMSMDQLAKHLELAPR